MTCKRNIVQRNLKFGFNTVASLGVWKLFTKPAGRYLDGILGF